MKTAVAVAMLAAVEAKADSFSAWMIENGKTYESKEVRYARAGGGAAARRLDTLASSASSRGCARASSRGSRRNPKTSPSVRLRPAFF